MNARPLASLLRAGLAGQRPLPPAPSGIAEVAARHRLCATLYHIGAELFEVDARQARLSWTNNVAAHLHRVSTVARVWPSWAPPPLVFKGADIGEHLFDDPGARRCSDLDLLLPDPHHGPVAAALAAQADEVRAPRYERLPGEPDYETGFRFGPVLIELHRDPQPPHRAALSGRAVWRRGRPARLGELDVLQPSPDDRLLLWLTNQAKQSFHGDLADLLDLAMILRTFPEGGSTAARRRADEAGLGRPYRLGLLRLAQSGLWPGALPAVDAADVHAVARLLPHPHAEPRPTPWWRFQLVKLWLAEGDARREILRRAAITARSRALR
jgi:hypothetical protein